LCPENTENQDHLASHELKQLKNLVMETPRSLTSRTFLPPNKQNKKKTRSNPSMKLNTTAGGKQRKHLRPLGQNPPDNDHVGNSASTAREH
jgi:hypothetical protein